ncbi:MAG TPA: hypothetical protein PLR88_03750 [Bacteroidales bacterium]|nr:hypothetical protein [Bacteroidales bacterium]HPT21039.1 hypothetical protein [Bacteroidales bacterium]
MSILDRFFRKKDPFKDVPAFKQIMVNVKMEEKAFLERIEKILPVISCKKSQSEDVGTADDQARQVSEGSQPISYPVNFDEDLSIYLEIVDGSQCEMLLNKQIIIAKDKVSPDQLVGKAFANLFKQIEDKISISMQSEDIGILSGCNNHESSLVLVNEVWKLIKDKIQSDEIVFGIPAKDVLIFTAADREEAVGQLNQKVKEIFNDETHPEKISSKLYILQKDGSTKIFTV